MRIRKKSPPLPPTAEFGAVVMKELKRRGGRAGRDELEEALRRTLSHGSETSRAWNKTFYYQFTWTMNMLVDLGEVASRRPSAEFTTWWYEAMPEKNLVVREARRQRWVVDWQREDMRGDG